MDDNRISETEDKIVENFLREQEESFGYDGTNGTNDGNDRSEVFNFEDDTALTEDIRKMARALAPQMSELEDVLKDFSEVETTDALDVIMHNNNASANDVSRSMLEAEDDDLDDEMEQLAMSEQALREELEFAAGISLLGTPMGFCFNDGDDNYNSSESNLPSPVNLNDQLEEQQQQSKPALPVAEESEPGAPPMYTLQDHAEYLHLKTERLGRWYYCDMTSKLMPSALSESPSVSVGGMTKDLVKDYCLPIPFRKLKRLYGGLVFYDTWETKRLKESQRPPSSTSSTPAETPSKTPLKNRLLGTPGIVTPSGFPTTVPVTPASTTTDASAQTPLQTPVKTPLKEINSAKIAKKNVVAEEPLPVRTISIRIRPDVLCGAVMDAAHHAFEILSTNHTSDVIKRQGGHLRGSVYMADKQLAYVVDMQLCTQKNDGLERRLLLRFYHIHDDPDALQELGQVLMMEKKRKERQKQETAPPIPQGDSVAPSTSIATTSSSSSVAQEENNTIAARHLKQTCSLIQRVMAAEKQEGGIKKMSPVQQSRWLGIEGGHYDTKSEMQSTVASHLESSFKSCPSVREENKKASAVIRRLTLPSLSKRDWPIVEIAWSLTNHIVEELDTRDCSYNTLATLPFGQFPSLPTLDVQFCSQLRRLSRENMITQLLKSAKDLEVYASRAEYKCAVCIALLDPMVERYGIPPLSLPKAKSLDEYPLDYEPPQTICPPWGGLVSEALNKVAAKTPTGDIDVKSAMLLVYRAFARQDDEEKGVRLGRKNAQVMERLANMQSHQRSLVQNIRDSLHSSEKSEKSASGFLDYCEKALNKGDEGYPSTISLEVPLLNLKISLGASQYGRCYITSKNILFVTTYIPLLGSSRSMAFDLSLIKFQVKANPTSSLMNPFPNTMEVVLKSNNKSVFSFRPAIGPARLHTFIHIIQAFASEKKPSEYSQVGEDSDEELAKEEPELSV
ncbi:unnamed protein product [Pseudo-nitzschia multistriata]|uniref:Uncharacterized protein n=1 Tax=Pseudo-nitzschia multistriata TaxID=183589 RepID=A0A448ZEU6_9STRA|nr:unnamed protein product [Pseudo-nitzschia multistriata]